MSNLKKSSAGMAKKAAHTLRDEGASKIAKRLAGSVLPQRDGSKRTGAELEDDASMVMRSDPRSARLGLCATPQQETVLRRAAEVAHKSLTDFILDAACQAAEQTLLDQRLFMVSGSQYQALLEMLDRPESDNPGLADLFSRRPVWANR
jgi:uncharacterized protein (DUF1778 family)